MKGDVNTIGISIALEMHWKAVTEIFQRNLVITVYADIMVFTIMAVWNVNVLVFPESESRRLVILQYLGYKMQNKKCWH